ncbi:hypothetical protein [Comamonas thiooxydans]|uniref:hypothetical protein n=1 Tax=Comamonas thiooxydans TaxID=363952 RepID=UPI0011872D6A|nr:hypothetical protein [Comamonas thiooxydans]
MNTVNTSISPTKLLSKDMALPLGLIALAIYGALDLLIRMVSVPVHPTSAVAVDQVQVNSNCVGFQLRNEGHYRYVMACQGVDASSFNTDQSDVKVHNCGSKPCVPPSNQKKVTRPLV